MADDLVRLVCQATECDWEALYGGMRYNPKKQEKCKRCGRIRTWHYIIRTKPVRLKDGSYDEPSGRWEYEDYGN